MKKALFSLGVLLLACGLGFAGGTGEKDDGKLDIAGIVFQEDQFFKVVQIGMRDAARDFGVNLLESNSNSKPDKEIELVNTYISRGVDAIVISPLSATASIAALKKANDKGIKVVLYNSPIDADFPISYLSSEASDLGIGSGKARRAISKPC
jgi:ABC-type sugar transport system substrate-binding protein